MPPIDTTPLLIGAGAVGLLIVLWIARVVLAQRLPRDADPLDHGEWQDVQQRLRELGRARALVFSIWFWRRCRRADRFERQGALERVIEELSRPVRASWLRLPGSIGCLEAQRLAAALGELGRYGQGRLALQPWVDRAETAPFPVPVQLLAADLALHAGDAAAAQAAAERAHDWAVDRRAWAHAYALMAGAARLRGDWNLALAEAERALEKEPGHPRALACQLACWSMLGQFEQAERAAAAALARVDGTAPEGAPAEGGIEHAIVRLLWADVAQVQGEWARVVGLLRPVAERDLPRRPLILAVRARLAGALAMLGEPEAGAQLLRQDSSAFRRFGLVRELAAAQAMAWARIHARVGQVRELDAALSAVDGQVRSPDERALFLLASGELWEAAGQQGTAEGCYRRAAGLDEALWAVRQARSHLRQAGGGETLS